MTCVHYRVFVKFYFNKSLLIEEIVYYIIRRFDVIKWFIIMMERRSESNEWQMHEAMNESCDWCLAKKQITTRYR